MKTLFLVRLLLLFFPLFSSCILVVVIGGCFLHNDLVGSHYIFLLF